jgi:hypothetical protein
MFFRLRCSVITAQIFKHWDYASALIALIKFSVGNNVGTVQQLGK